MKHLNPSTVKRAPEVKEEPGNFNELLARMNRGIEEWKKTVDDRVAEIAKKGTADPLTEDKLRKIETSIDEMRDMKKVLEDLEKRMSRPGTHAGMKDFVPPEQIEHRDAFIAWMRNPEDHQKSAALATAAAKAAPNQRDVTVGSNPSGGYAVPILLSQTIQRFGLDISPFRSVARGITLGSENYKELIDVGGATFGWVGENGARTATSTPQLQQVALTFGEAFAYPMASEKSLDDVFFDVENWLAVSVNESIAFGEGAAFLSGNGTDKPTGLLTAPIAATTDEAGTRAFGTFEYVPSGSTADITSFDQIQNLVAALRPKYLGNAVFYGNRRTFWKLAKIKDSQGRYIWEESVQKGIASRLFGYDAVIDPQMPDVAANSRPLMFGDFAAGYLIADIVGMRITRDNITLPGFVKYYFRKRVGGGPVNSQAIKFLKVATS